MLVAHVFPHINMAFQTQELNLGRSPVLSKTVTEQRPFTGPRGPSTLQLLIPHISLLSSHYK